MIVGTSTSDVQSLQTARVLSLLGWWAMILGAPLCYLLIAFELNLTTKHWEHANILLYVLLLLAIGYPLVTPYFERSIIDGYKKKQKLTLGRLYHTVVTFKGSLAHAPFLFAMIMFYLSSESIYFWYFYPIGIAWAVVFWPTRVRFEAFIEKAQVSSA